MKHDPKFLKLLATLSVMQGASFIILLGVAVPLKHLGGYAIGVTVMGAVHGALWLCYMWMLLAMMTLKMWTKAETARLMLSTLLPFGGFATARWLKSLPT
jgi:integral membrane protein